ncbi:hypothetical protein H0H81_000677 [Sphagnurus paluster]|uniref:Defective in cullin neddylation protein n=1 Tax=Sphagnurus paluster TaxID=117069 RepID=A0A9P7G2C4_9AGAR|nr:hypothetical protein H0H81_000677 [Sphagnurus paluster]
MPPKRKRTTEDGQEAATSTRATRSSTRTMTKAATTTSTARASKAKAKKREGDDEEDNPEEERMPPQKKTKTTKAGTKTTATKSTELVKGKKAPASSTNDDDELAHKKHIPEVLVQTQTPTTLNAPPPGPTRARSQTLSPPPGTNQPYSAALAKQLFSVYADSEDPSVIGPDGYTRLCTDAQIPLEGAAPLVLSWLLSAKEMGKVTQEEWRSGTEALRISNLYALSIAVRDLENLLVLKHLAPTDKKIKKDKEVYDKTLYSKYAHDPKAAFRKLYLFCFAFAKPEQSRNIEMETAAALWSVLLVPQYPIMADVIGFISERLTTYRAVNKDLWNMMLEFCDTVNPNLSDYEGDGAWPTLLDDFVLWKKGPTATTTN